jgi:uncharacterized protein (TIGR02145 family)
MWFYIHKEKFNLIIMRMKISLITIAGILISLFQGDIIAQTASKSEANVLAKNLVTKSIFNQKGLKGIQGITIEKTDSIICDGKIIGYFYQYKPSGYALIPKFKEINPYFAFSNNGKLNLDSDDLITSFLTDELILRYRALMDNKLQKETIAKNIHEWEGYLVKGSDMESLIQIPAAGTTSTGGLIETEWGQASIYDDFCPMDPITNIRCAVGCAPLAMAQIVNYWGNITGTPTSIDFNLDPDYTSMIDPEDGKGERVIKISPATASFSDITYPLSDQNIGRLNFACGVSLEAQYSSAATGAYPSAESFINKFGFKHAREIYYDNSFTDILYHNIASGMPCLLAISKPNMGHAIVCDGLIDDGTTIKFHLNYGRYGEYGAPTFFYEIPANLPRDYTTIEYGIVDIAIGFPDITIGSGTQTVSPAIVMAGTDFTASCAENNTGMVSVGSNMVSIQLSADHNLTPGKNGDIFLGEISIPGVSANTCSILFSNIIRMPSNVSPGSYYVFFVADNDQEIIEEVEDNNTEKFPITVTAACTPPTTQATTFTSSVITNTTMTAGWTRGNGDAVLVVARQGSPVNADPAGGVTYSSRSDFGSGTQIGTGNFIVYAGTATSVSLTALTPGTTYYFAVYEYSSGTNCYKIPSLTGNSTTSSSGVTITDIKGNVYSTVTIGTQVWMAENLKTTKYNDNTDIPYVSSEMDYAALTTPGYCWKYGNIASTYGALYNWYSVETASNGGRNVCPTGWHVPTDAQWTILTDYLTNNGYGYGGSGSDIAKSLASTTAWDTWIFAGTIGNNLASNNSSGFTALPGGSVGSNVIIGISGSNGHWWSVSENDITSSWSRSLAYNSSGIYRNAYSKDYGFSVRCLKDSEPYINIPALSTIDISELTQFTANTGGIITSDGGSPVTARGVCWSTSPEPIIANNKLTDGGGTASFTSSLTELIANTTYYLKAYATNSAGTGYGNLVVFKTKGGQEGTVTDIEGNIYKTITLGTQTWMAENLKVKKFNDNSDINYVSDMDWGDKTTPAYRWYISDPDPYGAYYNGYAVETSNNGGKNICPAGWHIPTDAEWTILTDYLTNNRYGYGGSGDDIAKSLASTTNWINVAPFYAGTIGCDPDVNNLSGFNALPGGYISNIGFPGLSGMYGYWWSGSSGSANNNWARILYYMNSGISRSESGRNNGFSVRCLLGEQIIGVDNIKADEISVYPNPVSGILNIKYNNSEIKSINILNSQGVILAKEKSFIPNQQLDFTRFKPGFYILEFVVPSGEILRVKLIKSN